MRQSLIFAAILLSVSTYGQSKVLKINFPNIDKSKVLFYSPVYQTETYHTIDGIGNLFQHFDSLTDKQTFITSFNIDGSTEDSLIKKCESPSNKLKIIIDTSQLTTKELNFYESYQLDKLYSSYPRQIITKDNKGITHKSNLTKDTTIKVIAQPIYIANLSNEIRYLKGISGHINLTQQALDKNNKWVDIETSTLPSCGMVKYIYELKPNDFALTTVLRFKGNYKTQFRIKLEANNQIYYSEPFSGYIDYLQIDNPKIKIIDYAAYERK